MAWEITAGDWRPRFRFLCWAGYLEEVRDELPRLLKDGAARGDVNMEVSLRLLSYVHYAYLSMDQPEHCIKECQEALSRVVEARIPPPELRRDVLAGRVPPLPRG